MTNDADDFTLHAWVDESMHVDAGLYLLAAVICEPGTCDPIRNTLRSLLDETQPKLHWSSESPERKSKIIETITPLDIAAAVVIGAPMNRRKQERARAVCMESLAVYLAEQGVTRTYLEARTESLNERDDRIIRSIRSKQLIPTTLRIEVARPSTEPMLWLPDIVAGAVGHEHVRHDSTYAEPIRSVVDVIHIPLR